MAKTSPTNTSTKRTPRGASYTPAEDTGVAKAWIAVSENAITGTEKKGDDFIFQVCGKYNGFFRPLNREVRTFESIKSRCKLIVKHCTTFSSCYARVISSKPTGVSPTDLLRLATALFNGVQVSNASDDCGKPFRFAEAWDVLRTHPKFMAGGIGEGGVAGDAAESGKEEDDVDGEASNKENEHVKEAKPKAQARPVGRRKAKEDAKKENYNREKLRLAEESVAAEKERTMVLKRHYEIMLFQSASTSPKDEAAAEYFKIMRARALNELKNDVKKQRIESQPSASHPSHENGDSDEADK